MGSLEKAHQLRYLLHIFFEPNDVVDKIPGTGFSTDFSDQLSRVMGNSQGERKKRVDIFIQWLQKEEQGNNYKEFVDVLRQDESYEWLTPLLDESENVNFDCIKYFKYVKKPEKIGSILNKIFPAMKDIQVVDIVKYLRNSLTESDREEVVKTANNRSNREGLIALLNILIRKNPVWIAEFVKAVGKLNYTANPMFEDSIYTSLEEALNDYLGNFEVPEGDDDGQEGMEFSYYHEDEEQMNEATIASCSSYTLFTGQTKNFDSKSTVSPQCKVDEDESVDDADADAVAGFELRGYQTELCKNALIGENVVICAQTGSGKTVAAAEIIKQHLENGSGCQSTKCKVAFFTPTGGLAEQQYDKMKKYLSNVSIELLRGNYGADHVEKKFKKKIYGSDLIVMTPQILLNCLKDETVCSVFEFSLMIFDECHHVNGSEPYAEILKKYLDEKRGVEEIRRVKKSYQKKRTMQIIGLTATLGIGSARNDEEAVEHIFKVLGVMDASGGIAMIKIPDNIEELQSICPTPAEETKMIDIGKDDEFRQMLIDTTKQLSDILVNNGVLNKFGKLISPPNDKIDQLGKDFETWCYKLRHASGNHYDENSTDGRDAGSGASAMQCMKKGYDLCRNCQPSDAIGLIEEFVTTYFVEQQEKNTDSENHFHKLMDDALLKFRKYAGQTKNQVLEILEEKLIKKSQENTTFKCMVMVSRRHFARCLERWMKESPSLRDFKPKTYIGIGNKSSACPGMSHRQQKETIESFRSGDCRILVCTPDAAGEGIDIPDCNLVVTIDCIRNEITKVQLSGRVRAKNGAVLNIYFSNDEQRDTLTTEKRLIMQRATKTIDKLFRRENEKYKKDLLKGQDSVIKASNQAKLKMRANHLPRPLGGDSVLCRKCNKPICKTKDLIRVNGNHHTVQNQNFKEMYFKSEHQSKGAMLGNMMHLFRIRCIICKHEWGNEVALKGYLVPILTVTGFKIRDSRGKIFQPSKWKSTKLLIPEVRDITRYDSIFAKCEEEED